MYFKIMRASNEDNTYRNSLESFMSAPSSPSLKIVQKY